MSNSLSIWHASAMIINIKNNVRMLIRQLLFILFAIVPRIRQTSTSSQYPIPYDLTLLVRVWGIENMSQKFSLYLMYHYS